MSQNEFVVDTMISPMNTLIRRWKMVTVQSKMACGKNSMKQNFKSLKWTQIDCSIRYTLMF